MYHGDFNPNATARFTFNTVNSSAVPTTLAGSPALAVYKLGSTTETTSGVTLTVDFDSVTGFHQVAIDTSASPLFYTSGGEFSVVLTAGTVGGVSVVGMKVGSFSIGRIPNNIFNADADGYLGAGGWGEFINNDLATIYDNTVGLPSSLLSVFQNNLIVDGDSPQRVFEVVRKDTYIGYGREFTFVKHPTETWPNDLTGWTITFTANLSPDNTATGSQTGVASVTLDGTVTVATGTDQTVTLAPGTTETNALAIGVGAKGYYWDIVGTFGTNRATLRYGVMNVRENQTA